jgi:hypothetical protein
VALLVPFFEYKFNLKLREKDKKETEAEMKEVYQIDILVDTSLLDNMVRFSASIHNVGDKQIITKTSQLYIDQGYPVALKNDRNKDTVGQWYEFPFILEHKNFVDGRPDCVLCEKCFRQSQYDYPEDVVSQTIKAHAELVRTHLELNHLSNKSIKYINPKEKFSEDIVVQFPQCGVYRVTFFVGMEGEADCQCATKQFYIPNSLPMNSEGGS